MLIVVGWGGQYLAFNNALEILRVSLMTEGKEVPPTLLERVNSRKEPPKCSGGSVARLVVLPSFTGTFAVSNRGIPVDPSSTAASASYSLTFSGLRAYECEGNPPVLRPPARRFAPELLAWICAYGDFPRLKGTSCSKCGSELRAADSVSFGRIETDVALPNVEPFQLVYQGPAFTCPNCWTRQISPPAHCGGIGKAVMAALNNAGIKERWQDRIFG